MSQSQTSRLVSKLRYNVTEKKKFKAGGPQQRHDRLRKIVTALLRHERLELKYVEGEEARGYAERLISDAIRHGECHVPTMEMASYWITDKPIVHKLFKVLAPRYKYYDTVSYTKMWRAPRVLPGHGRNKCVLELRNNIYPPLGPDRTNYKNLIHNVLLREAKKFFDQAKQKEAEIQLKQKLTSTETKTETSTSSPQTAVSENLESVKDSQNVDSKEFKNENSSSSTEKDSVESQNTSDSTTKDTSETLGIDKMKIKDEELPKEEK